MWNLVIRTLSSSKFVRNTIRSVYQFWQEKHLSTWMIIAGAGLLAGFIGGITVYHLASLLK